MKNSKTANTESSATQAEPRHLPLNFTDFIIDMIRHTVPIAHFPPDGEYRIFLNDQLVGTSIRHLEAEHKTATDSK
jgi:hypothetical protein